MPGRQGTRQGRRKSKKFLESKGGHWHSLLRVDRARKKRKKKRQRGRERASPGKAVAEGAGQAHEGSFIAGRGVLPKGSTRRVQTMGLTGARGAGGDGEGSWWPNHQVLK